MLFAALLIITAIWIMAAGLSPWRRVTHYAASCAAREQLESAGDIPSAASMQEAGNLPSVSVVAFVHRDEDAVSDYLDVLLSQDYPRLEVVLVCDASAEATAMISERFENVENLHITFIPPGSHNLSRRKLAQTIGIKASKGDVVLLTSTSVLPRSSGWVSQMARPFIKDPSLAVVLGYVHPVFEDFTGAGKWYRQFDHLIETTAWMNAAIADNAYRGDGYNMAFRRRLFFENKGYASTIPLMDGDDDIFIRELSRFGRVELQVSPSSMVDTRWGEQADRRHLDLKDRRVFTRHYLPREPFVRMGMMSSAQWCLLITAILAMAGGVFAWVTSGISTLLSASADFTDSLIVPAGMIEGIVVTAIGLLALLGVWGLQIRAYRQLAGALGATRLFWAVTPFLLWRPIGNTLFNINHRTTRKSHFTWQR